MCRHSPKLGYPDSDVPIWYAIFAPAGTPKEIIAKLNAKIVEIAKTEDMQARMRAISAVVPIQTPEQMASYLDDDTNHNGEPDQGHQHEAGVDRGRCLFAPIARRAFLHECITAFGPVLAGKDRVDVGARNAGDLTWAFGQRLRHKAFQRARGQRRSGSDAAAYAIAVGISSAAATTLLT